MTYDTYKPIKAALYCRISTSDKDQKTDSQAFALEQYCKTKGYSIYQVYEDIGISGTKASRPQLDLLMGDAKAKLFDIVVVYKFDRFARNTSFLLKSLEEFRSLGIDFCSVSESLDTNTPMGEAMFTIIGALGALERATIVERIKSGLQAARARGRKLGKPKQRIDADILRLRNLGLSIRKIAAELKISKGSVQRALASYSKPYFESVVPMTPDMSTKL